MRNSTLRMLAVSFLLTVGTASAGPLGFFQVIGQGTSQGEATSNAYASAAAICAGRGLVAGDQEVIEVQQFGSLVRVLLRARCV